MIDALKARMRHPSKETLVRRELAIFPVVRVLEQTKDLPVKIGGVSLLDLGTVEVPNSMTKAIEHAEKFSPIFASVFTKGALWWRRPVVRFWAHPDDARPDALPFMIQTADGFAAFED